MKLAIFTSNSRRHKYLANTLCQNTDKSLIVSECMDSGYSDKKDFKSPLVAEHFDLRAQTEEKFFGDSDFFRYPTLPLLKKEINQKFVYQTIKKFDPDLVIVFGSSIIKEPLLSLPPKNRFINLHLGLSPYYRGSGTNFWPLVNQEPGFVGSTILHIDAGVDTGDIIAHVQPEIESTDNVHTLGCKVIKESVKALKLIIEKVKTNQKLNRVKQWPVENEKYYRKKDFTEESLKQYYHNLSSGLLSSHKLLKSSPQRLINLK